MNNFTSVIVLQRVCFDQFSVLGTTIWMFNYNAIFNSLQIGRSCFPQFLNEEIIVFGSRSKCRIKTGKSKSHQELYDMDYLLSIFISFGMQNNVILIVIEMGASNLGKFPQNIPMREKMTIFPSTNKYPFISD